MMKCVGTRGVYFINNDYNQGLTHHNYSMFQYSIISIKWTIFHAFPIAMGCNEWLQGSSIFHCFVHSGSKTNIFSPIICSELHQTTFERFFFLER